MNKFKEIDFNLLSKKIKTKGALIDSSVIIYLDKLLLLSLFVENYKILTLSSIKNEVTLNKNKQLNEHEIINKICEMDKNNQINGLIKLYELKELNVLNKVNDLNKENVVNELDKLPIIEKFLNDLISKNLRRKISETDFNLIFYSILFEIPIFTDDGIISRICRENNFNYYNSLIVPLLLFFDHIISDKQAINYLFYLSKIGRYSNEIFNFAFNLLEKTIKNNKI